MVITGCIFLFTSRWAFSWGPGGMTYKWGFGGRFMSESLRYGFCQLQCPDYFSGFKPQAVERCFKPEHRVAVFSKTFYLLRQHK